MLLSIGIFCIVLLIYLHVYYHLKVSNDLEIYELDDLDKSKMEEVCNMRQPILLKFPNENITRIFSHKTIMNDYNIFDVKVRKWEENNNECQHIPLKMSLANKLIEKNNSEYYSERNSDFLEETGLVKHIKAIDDVFKPYLNMTCHYDMLFGTINSCTPLKYNVFNRNYFYVCDGTAKIKLIPPMFSKYLHVDNDYENFEFRSPINVWNVQKEFSDSYVKSKVMEIKLQKNSVVYVPSYWFYSIQFGENAVILNCGYSTLMSAVATIPQRCLYLLQQQNITRRIAKSIPNIDIENITETLAPVATTTTNTTDSTISA